jgi:hypothetical protein
MQNNPTTKIVKSQILILDLHPKVYQKFGGNNEAHHSSVGIWRIFI